MTSTASIFHHGARIVPDFITVPEEERILLRISQASWLTELSRRVQHYGFAYDYRGGGSRQPAAPFPPWVRVMAERLQPHFGTVPVQCIVNEYRPGQGIGMHADHSDFGPVVASLSLGADWPMRFRPRDRRPYAAGAQPGDEIAVLPRRSVLVLAGDSRQRFMHGIDRGMSARETATRTSATFRTLAG